VQKNGSSDQACPASSLDESEFPEDESVSASVSASVSGSVSVFGWEFLLEVSSNVQSLVSGCWTSFFILLHSSSFHSSPPIFNLFQSFT
jgi:hypothetical protein